MERWEKKKESYGEKQYWRWKQKKMRKGKKGNTWEEEKSWEEEKMLMCINVMTPFSPRDSNQRTACARSVRVSPHVCCQVYKVQVSVSNIVSDATGSMVHTTSIHNYPPSVSRHVPRCSIPSQHISPMMGPNELPQNPISINTPLGEDDCNVFRLSGMSSYRCRSFSACNESRQCSPASHEISPVVVVSWRSLLKSPTHVTPESQDAVVKLSGSWYPCSPHRIHRGSPALIGRQDWVPASSGKSQSSQRHQDSQPVFVVMFRRQIAHIAVSDEILQRELPRLYGLPSPEPLHVQVSHSPRSNSVVHAEVCGTVREYFQLRLHSSLNQQLDWLQSAAAARPVAYSSASPLERAMTCCIKQLSSMGCSPCCSNAPVVLRRDSEPAQSESPDTTYFSGTSCAW